MSLITWNPSDKSSSVILSNNNLTYTISDNVVHGGRVTVGRDYGKWYWEITIDSAMDIDGCMAVIANAHMQLSTGTNLPTQSTFRLHRPNLKQGGSAGNGVSYGGPLAVNDTIGVALDIDNGFVEFFKNGISLGVAFTDANIMGTVYPAILGYTSTLTANFGATEFDIAASNPTAWNQLISEGYQPYDIDNATWLYKVKHLIKSSNKIQTLSNGGWVDTLLTEPLAKVDFEVYGIDELANAPINLLQKPFSILTWVDSEEATKITLHYSYDKPEPKWLELQTDPFSPIEKLNQEEEFEVITWTDYKTELPSSKTSTEETVDEGKLFKATLEDFVAITGVEVN